MDGASGASKTDGRCEMAAVLEKVQRLEMQILAFVCENLHESASLSE